jgi:lysophospholipase L1-like esterase
LADVKKILGFTSYLVVSVLFLLITIELVVRVFFKEINFQGNQRSMFVENKYNKTFGLIPNSTGKFFGKKIDTDEYGFRKMNSPTDYEKSWLFVGDSVTFGVGVDTKKIFPQLIQNEFRSKKIYNAAVIGYSTLNYLDLIDAFLRDHDDIEKVILFFCLNDVYGGLTLNNRNISAKEKALSLLRSNSKFYLLLKNIFFDRSKTYTLYDIDIYKKDKSAIDKYLNAVLKIKAKTDKSNIDFMIVILPYEYQLRMGDLKIPQVLLNNYFTKHGINTLDMYDDFTLFDSESYFLYGDPMHLSPLGHKIVAEKMVELLR